MSPTETAAEKPSDSQQKFAIQAAEALAAEFGVAMEDFEVVRVDQPEDTEPEVELEEGDDGYDGKPWKEAVPSIVARYAVRYAGEADLEDFDVEAPGSISVNGWEFPIGSYPPDDPDGVPEISIPQDL